MNMLKVCFIGVGSIAKRHIRNLHAICNDKRIDVTIDAFRRSKGEIEGVNSVYCIEAEVPNGYDAIFITNPTDLHLVSLEQFHEKGKHFLKNLLFLFRRLKKQCSSKRIMIRFIM